MAKVKANQPLTPSLVDRLLDDEPDVTKEAARSNYQILRELKQSVRRDLENLLNTRRRALGFPASLKELEKSLVNYGIPDITGANLGSAQDRDQFRKTLETVIKNHEPRFKTVKVSIVDNPDPLDRTLRFRVDALLYADPAPEPVVFDSSLEPGTGTFEVKGVSG